ncbi:MAG: DNA mismatch repair endonuclease MutL [Mobilitalea sp.]
MPIIHVLDNSTINQIAAGEVVERPSAIVKELIENAMDAGATAITLEIKEGGLNFIRITDNGCGISKEDIPLAFLRHATSKIKTAEDLLSVTSLGFRGEALSSIAAVSQVELITKTTTALIGYRYIIEGNEEKSFEEIGCPAGTTIIIRNVFYNTPARRKFLKSATTEAGYISDLMERLIVSHPKVSFKYIANNQVKLQSSGNSMSKDILYNIYGREVSKELLPIEYHSETVNITGYIGKPMITRGNRNHENYFINGRYIKSSVITKAIEEAYKPFLMHHKYPFTSIYFEIDPSLIDVNVHPQKMEVRLKNGEEIYQLTQQLIRTTLSGKELIPKVVLTPNEQEKQILPQMPEPFEHNRMKQMTGFSGTYENKNNKTFVSKVAEHSEGYNKSSKPFEPRVNQHGMNYIEATKPLISSTSPLAETLAGVKIERDNNPGIPNAIQNNIDVKVNEATIPKEDVLNKLTKQMSLFEGETADAPFLSSKAVKEHRIVGQVFSTYWIIEYQKELYFIDQHAAHEKVLYEKLMAAAKEKTFVSQQIMPPIVLTLSLKEQEVLKKQEELLLQLGYEFEHFGGNEYSVRAVPADLYHISEKELLLEFIDSLSEEVQNAELHTASILERAATISCKAAIKANHKYSFEEASALINELLSLENPYHCPHGRPVIISMSQYELERKFKRII